MIMLSRQRHALFVGCLAQAARPLGHSPHFTLYQLPGADHELAIVHRFGPTRIDNDLGWYVVAELLPLLQACDGLATAGYAGYSEQDIFERSVGDIVRSSDGDERRAWRRFYDNTVQGLQDAPARPFPADESPNFIAHFSAIYGLAADLIEELAPTAAPPSVLDMATCFGFFPLLLARRWREVPARIVGCDLNPALVAFANDYAGRRDGQGARFGVADVLAPNINQQLAPLPGRYDAVTALHLLEHLEPSQTGTAVANLWRLTGRRLIIAVPLEETPDPRYGHRQAFDQARLSAIGAKLGGEQHYLEHHGGWLVVDRRPERAMG